MTKSYPNERDCEHGSMRGKCDICEYEQDIKELESFKRNATQKIADLEHKNKSLKAINLGFTKALLESESRNEIRDLEQQAQALNDLLDMTDTWSVMNTYAITVDDIYEQMQELREQAAKLKEQSYD